MNFTFIIECIDIREIELKIILITEFENYR